MMISTQMAFGVKSCKRLIIVLLFLHTGVSTWSRGSNTFDDLSPKLREFLDHNTSAETLLKKVFAESFSNRRHQVYYVYGSSQPPACHYYSETDGVGIIIREDQQALDQFLCLVYESVNSENENDFQELCHKAELGTISKVDFAHGVLKVEFESVKKAKIWLRQLRFPKKETSNLDYYKHFLDCPDTFERFLAYIKSESMDRVKDYEMKYDLLRKHPSKSD